MARWRVCDEHWYWFISFHGPSAGGTDPEVLKALGITKTDEEINLWPCRHCGAMVMGVKRDLHTRFHTATNTCYSDAVNPDEDIVEESNEQVQ